MKNRSQENGAITIVVLVSVLFMISFLISSYILISNKVNAQKDVLEETRSIYESKLPMEEIYNSYFNNDNMVPIYTVEQLLDVGSGKVKQISQENGKIYNFSKDANYMLMNDIQFKTSEYTSLIGTDEQGNPKEWTAIGEMVKNDVDGFIGNFEGNGHKILVEDLNGILHECNKDNEYYYYRNIDLVIMSSEQFLKAGEFNAKILHMGGQQEFGKESLTSGADRIFAF